jgi:toxin FitB
LTFAVIILDTNVVSEMMSLVPEPNVAAWYEKQDSQVLFTTSITLADVFYGVELLPIGVRRDRLRQLALDFFETEMAGKILSFTERAAIRYAEMRAMKRRIGKSMSPLDAQIAAIALAAGASIATRNVTDFEHCGVTIIDPWLA